MEIIKQLSDNVVRQDGITAESIDNLRRQIVFPVIEGEVDPLKTLAAVKAAMSAMEAAVKEISDYAMNELQKHGKSVNIYGVKIERSSTGDTLDYEKDEVWCKLRDRLKYREGQLKTAANSKDLIVEDGEVVVPRVPIKSAAKEIVKVTLPKK